MLTHFLIGFIFSFSGSIPPGVINLSVLQLGIEKKNKIAWWLSLGAIIPEYGYALLAVKIGSTLLSSGITDKFKLITAIVLIGMGVLNLLPAKKTSGFSEKIKNAGFKRGVVLGILNPMALPFWVGWTAFFLAQHWIVLETSWEVQAYLAGIAAGTFVLLILLANLSQKLASRFQNNPYLKKIPGAAMLVLGLISLAQYFLEF